MQRFFVYPEWLDSRNPKDKIEVVKCADHEQALAEKDKEIEQLRNEVALLKADDAEGCELIRDMEDEERRKDAVIEEQAHEIARLREALEHLVDTLGGDSACRLDHHGLCKEHFLNAPCEVHQAQQALKETTK